MKTSRVALGVCALALLAATPSPAEAAWNNVFQVCCHRRPTTSSYYVAQYPVAAASPCCPQPQPCTSYVQRCFFQPVTTYQTQSYYEPVTTYQTSYFYEPVTSYRVSCYVDPCTGCSRQVTTPVTSYLLRSKCCPVQSWVQRCASVPVTTYQRSCYWEQVNPCCPPASAAVAPIAVPSVPPPPAVGGNGVSPSPPPAQTPPPPMVDGQSSGPYTPQNGSPVFDRSFQAPAQPMPQGSQRPSWNPSGSGTPSQTVTPPIKLDRIVVGPGDAMVEGTLIRTDNAPRAGVPVTFISVDRYGVQQSVTTSNLGRFRVALDQGSWYIYLTGEDGRPTYHSQIEITGSRTGQLTLLSR
jgi:hypothetical protein